LQLAQQAIDAARVEMSTHAPALTLLDDFEASKQEAHFTASALDRCTRALAASRDVELLVREAIAATAHDRTQPGWKENRVALASRRAAAGKETRRLRLEHKRLEADLRRHNQRLLSLTHAATPLVSDKAQCLVRERLALEQTLRERHEAARSAKAAVRGAMAALGTISVNIGPPPSVPAGCPITDGLVLSAPAPAEGVRGTAAQSMH